MAKHDKVERTEEIVEIRIPMPAPPSPTRLTDEGLPFEWLDPDETTLVNLATERYDARRYELRVKQQTFTHVAEDSARRWIYRCD